jgi:beta-lactamase class C
VPTANYRHTEFVEWIDRQTAETGIPGAALAIVSRDAILHLQTWGVRSLSNPEPITPESIFRIASMSKTFAGTAAAKLVEQDLTSWDTLLTDTFPDLRLGTKRASRNITLKHVVSQSTGLMPHSFSNLLDDGIDYERIRARFDDIPTVCAPGECYGYQNVVFSLTADVVEQATGASYAQFVAEQIFKPLGMKTASIGLEPYVQNPLHTDPHRRVRGRWRVTQTNPAYYSVEPASGINASVADMSLWLRANLGGFPEVLSPDFLSEVHEPVISTSYGSYFNRWPGVEKAYYALGWRVFDYRGMRVVHHGGGVRGYRSEMAFVPEANLGIVLLFNAESKVANDVVPAFLDTITVPGRIAGQLN